MALLASLLAVGGCGDDGGGGDAEPTATTGEEAAAPADVFDRDACELLTVDRVAELLGPDAAANPDATPGDATISQPAACTWSTGEPINLADPGLNGLTVFLGDDQIFRNSRILAEDGEDYEELDLGDEAYVGGGVGGVLIDGVGITVTPLGTDENDPAPHDLVVGLLEDVAANL